MLQQWREAHREKYTPASAGSSAAPRFHTIYVEQTLANFEMILRINSRSSLPFSLSLPGKDNAVLMHKARAKKCTESTHTTFSRPFCLAALRSITDPRKEFLSCCCFIDSIVLCTGHVVGCRWYGLVEVSEEMQLNTDREA